MLDDLLHRARSEEQLRQVLYGRIENVARERLEGACGAELTSVLDALSRFLGHDHIELG